MKKLKNKIFSWVISKFNIGKIDDIVSKVPVINIIYKFFIQKTINYDFPGHIFIESTSACNLRCKMCARNQISSTFGNMDFSLFKKIVDEAKKYGPRSFSPYGNGEPLLAPNIIEMIKYIKESNPDNTVILTTNGTLLTKEKSEELVKYQVDKIAISFTSPDRKTYFEKTGVDKLEEVEKNIKQLIDIKKEKTSYKPLIFIRMIADQDTKSQAKEFLQRWENEKVIAEVRPMHNYGGNVKVDYIKINTKRYPCYHLWLAPTILWDGDFVICCSDYGRKSLMGNIKNQTINEIWKGEKMQKYRRAHLSGNYDEAAPCNNCDVWNIYSDLFFKWQKK